VKTFSFKLAAVILSVLAFLVGLEIVVRAFHLARPRLSQADPVFGHAYIPGQIAVNRFGVTIEIGRHGFRGPAPSFEKKPGVFRVVMLGDSYLFAEAVPYEKIFHRLINQKFAAKNRPIELINMGVDGYGTVQEYLVYHHLAQKYHPDLVILFFYAGNDLTDNYPPRDYRPGARIVDGELHLVPFEINPGKRNFLRDFLRKNVRIYSYLPDLLREAVNNWSAAMSGEVKKDRFESEQAQFNVAKDMTWTREILREEKLDLRWRVTLAVIRKLADEVEKDGGRLALAVIPTITQVHDQYWRQLLVDYRDFDTSGWDRFKPQKILDNFAQAEGLSYLPLSRKLAEAAGTTDEIFYGPKDFHFNEAGHAVVAQILASEIESLYEKWAGSAIQKAR